MEAYPARSILVINLHEFFETKLTVLGQKVQETCQTGEAGTTNKNIIITSQTGPPNNSVFWLFAPWEGALGSPRDPMGGDPWEPKRPHGRGPLGAQRIPWEGILGSPGRGPFLESPGTTEDQFGGSWGLQEPFWRCSVMK